MLKEIFKKIIKEYDTSIKEIEELENLLKEYKKQKFIKQKEYKRYEGVERCYICDLPGVMYEFKGEKYDCNCLTDVLIKDGIITFKRNIKFEILMRDEYYFKNELIKTLDLDNDSHGTWMVIDKLLNELNIKDLDE